mgnify:CR=1 FL=1
MPSLSKIKLKSFVFALVLSFILTACFYFPGLLHALSVMKGNEKCSSLYK